MTDSPKRSHHEVILFCCWLERVKNGLSGHILTLPFSPKRGLGIWCLSQNREDGCHPVSSFVVCLKSLLLQRVTEQEIRDIFNFVSSGVVQCVALMSRRLQLSSDRIIDMQGKSGGIKKASSGNSEGYSGNLWELVGTML